MVVTKSPLSGSITCSTAEGYFGPELKFAGYDGIIVEGRASEPVYLSIEDEKVEILSASHLWGKSTLKTEELIRREKENVWVARETSVASIGHAGEKLAKIASIVNDRHRVAARAGVGAVMGSQNLNAIAVRGTTSVTLADGAKFMDAAARAWEKFKTTPVIPQALNNIGTPFQVDLINDCGALPVRNFQTGVMKEHQMISGEHMAETILKAKKGCFACPIACGRVSEIKTGKWAGKEGEGPEYESVVLLGSACDVEDLNAITMANFLCNEYGLDTISAGSIVAFAMECYEKGIISKKDTNGIELTWGWWWRYKSLRRPCVKSSKTCFALFSTTP